MQAGLNVVISTGSGGGSTGNIFWGSGADLEFQGLTGQSLTLQTDPLDTGREVDIQGAVYDFSTTSGEPTPGDQFSLNVVTGGSDGLVTLTYVVTNGGAVNVASGAAGIKLSSNYTFNQQYLGTNGGNLALTGNVLLETNVTLDTTLTESHLPAVGGNLSISGTVDGDGQQENLFLATDNGTISLGGDLGGVNQLLSSVDVYGNLVLTADLTITVQNYFELDTGLLDIGSNTLTVDTGILVIGGGQDISATLTGTGTVAASFAGVNTNGIVASPERVEHPRHPAILDGNTEFRGGSQLQVGLGATPDLLHVTGTAQVDSGAELTIGSGQLGDTTPQPVLTADGGLTGTFTYAATPIDLGGVHRRPSRRTIRPAPSSSGKFPSTWRLNRAAPSTWHRPMPTASAPSRPRPMTRS